MISVGCLDNPPWKKPHRVLGRFINQLKHKGITARLVGGVVRESLLGRFNPACDLDIAVNISPSEMIATCLASGIQVIPSGIQFGTVTCILGKQSYEFTSLRKDISTNGRKAVVSYTKDWKEDAFRRDLTINALYADWDGQYYDPTSQGIEDLHNHYLRFIGDPEQRIKEDFLRIIRFFRFMALFPHAKYDTKAYDTCIDMGKHLETISTERKWSEVQKIFKSIYPLNAIESLLSSKLMLSLCRINWSLNKLERSIPWIQNCFHEVFYAVLGGINHFKVDRNVCIPLNLQKRIEEVCRVNFQLPIDHKVFYRTGRAIYRDAYARYTMINYEFSKEALYRYNQEIQKIDAWVFPKFPVSGTDLQDLGFVPGAIMGNILTETEKWWVDNNFIPDFNECIKYIQRLHLDTLKSTL